MHEHHTPPAELGQESPATRASRPHVVYGVTNVADAPTIAHLVVGGQAIPRWPLVCAGITLYARRL